ncbi:MAG: peptidyl-prolyl cis-trans isomerase, partial [bacterium]|nr:peptidyl-prolyl cis-trans isomerase [bacterium]
RELRGLIDAYIKEEVYYREAVKLALDRDDTLIRRRMQQKMEFLSEPSENDLAADDVASQAFLDDSKPTYRVQPRVVFEQVFVNPKQGMDVAKRRAAAVLAALKSGESPAGLGDPTLLPASKTLSTLRGIERDFGEAFAKALVTAPVDQWAGPVDSAFGLHLVRVGERADGYEPDLAEVREKVLLDWRTLQREEYEKQAYETLLAEYDILLPAPENRPAQTEPGP